VRRAGLALWASLALAACNTILGTTDVTGPADGDAGVDAPDSPPGTTALRSPALGAPTGSVHATSSLRPRFAWEPTPGATRYEIQVDDSCALAAFRACLFPSPEVESTEIAGVEFMPSSDLSVALTPPVGRRYYWRVRGCNVHGCGDYSEVWYVDVGRLRDDVNGDGYGDVIVGIASGSTETVTVGRAYVVFGRVDVAAPAAVALPDPRSTADGHFGAAVAMVGDINADGYGDVAVGAWNTPRASHLGWVYIYTGRGTWPSTLGTESAGYGLATPDPANHFGMAIAGGGDVNGDGYADFAVTALEPGLTATMPGYVYVNYGRSTLPMSQLGSDRNIPDPEGASTGMFGWSLTMGDVDVDGFGDVVVGAIGRGGLSGDTAMYFGGRDSGMPPINVTGHDVRIAPGAATPAGFGFVSSVCPTTSNAPLIAVGAPFESAPGQGAGRVRLYRGHEPWPAEIAAHDAAIDDPSGAFRASFGRDLACGDVTADGRVDVVAAAPTPDDDGVIFLFDDVAALPTMPSTTLSAGIGIVGHQVKVTDFNGDGIPDVVASRLRGPATPAGAVLIWFGRQAWPATITDADLVVPNPSGVAGERFGESLD